MGKIIMLKNVRCSFPQLWNEEERNGTTYPRGITLLFSPLVKEDEELLKAVKSAMKEAGDENPDASAVAFKKGNLCLRDGDHDSYDEGTKILKANTRRTPLVLKANATKATEDDDPIYSGCYVNAKVEFWVQDNNFGKRINCKLIAIQFAKDGESFDGSYIPEEKALEGFDSVSGDDDFDF